jgi:hypothetical protein
VTKISRSPQRNTFQAKGKPSDVQAMWDDIRQAVAAEESDPQWAAHNLEHDLRTSEDMCERVRDETYAQNLYAALCNNTWRRDDDVARKLTGETWSCSWRHAGGIVADMRGEGDYIDWYMSGMDPWGDGMAPGCVPEGTVTDRIRADIGHLGWSQVEDVR